MIISRKRFEAEVTKRVEEAVCKVHENMWRDQRERDMGRDLCALEARLIEVEKKSGIDHPSHHNSKICY